MTSGRVIELGNRSLKMIQNNRNLEVPHWADSLCSQRYSWIKLIIGGAGTSCRLAANPILTNMRVMQAKLCHQPLDVLLHMIPSIPYRLSRYDVRIRYYGKASFIVVDMTEQAGTLFPVSPGVWNFSEFRENNENRRSA